LIFLLATSGNKSVPAGSSVTNRISAALVSGNTQAVTYSVADFAFWIHGFVFLGELQPDLLVDFDDQHQRLDTGRNIGHCGGGNKWRANSDSLIHLTVNLPTAAAPTISPKVAALRALFR
jgi:hypothetical protein